MPKQSRTTIMLLINSLLALPAAAQPAAPPTNTASNTVDNTSTPSVVARQATPEEVGYEVIASPMLLDISLGAHGKGKSLRDMDEQHVWTITDTAGFVCEKARVKMVQVWKVQKRGQVTLRVIPMLAAENTGRAIDVTVAIVSGGKEIRKGLLRVDTTGSDTASPGAIAVVRVPHVLLALPIPQVATRNSTAEFDFEFTEQEFASMFEVGRAPLVRMILDIQ
jgi:hypothetical protein